MGEFNRAIEYHEQTVLICHETGNRRGNAADLGNLGIVHRHLGDIRKAIALAQSQQ
jgi:Tetratricopeptide repeat